MFTNWLGGSNRSKTGTTRLGSSIYPRTHRRVRYRYGSHGDQTNLVWFKIWFHAIGVLVELQRCQMIFKLPRRSSGPLSILQTRKRLSSSLVYLKTTFGPA